MATAFANYPSLQGMPVVISGGASGIGETLVREFARQGSKVGFVDIAADAGRRVAAELVAEGDTMWQEGAARGDLVALAGRSRGVEAAALTDPGGLGAHRVPVLRKEV